MKIIAHRGYSSQYPENTMLAFKKAVEINADGIELDARLTSDGQVVIMHDSSVDRTTNGSGIVREMTLQDIKALDAGSSFGIAFENEPVPLLEEVFSALGNKTLINVELANYEEIDERSLADLVGDLIVDYHLEESVLISSFRFNNLVYIKDKHPTIPCALLANRGFKGFLARNVLTHSISVDGLHPYYTDTTEALVNREHQCSRAVRVWTVDDVKEIKRLDSIGVDAIFSNDPINTRNALSNE